MKLLLAASLYPPEARGPSTFAGQLVEHLRARGWDVSVVKFRDVRHLPLVVRHAVYFFKLLLHGRGARVVLALDPVSTGIPAIFASKLLRAKFVLRIGGDYAWEQGRQRAGVTDTLDEFIAAPKSKYPRSVWVLSALQGYVARHASKLVAPSRYLKGVALAWGVASQNTEVIYTVVGGASPLSRDEARKKLGLGGEPLVFCLAALVPWKGIPTLLKVIAGLRTKHPGLQLTVAGDGPFRTEYEGVAKELGFDIGKTFIGDIPNASVLEYLRAADAFALNTSYEGLSHVLVEAMHAGTPIVTTPAGGNPELIEDKKTGLLVPYDNSGALTGALDLLLTNRDEAQRLGAAAKEFVAREFALEKSMTAWEALLKTI